MFPALKILLHIYAKKFFTKRNKIYIEKIHKLKSLNYSLLIQAIYDKILIDLVCCKLSEKKLLDFLNCYVVFFKNNPNRKFQRVSLLPFSKWYVKKYHKSYNWSKIINAIITKTIENLNKNLKSKANKIKDKLIFCDLETIT